MKLTIGTKGSFEFLPPFDTASDSTVFEIISINDIVEMESNNLLPYKLVYEKAGLSRSVMYEHIQNGTKIVTLKSVNGYAYIPDSHISGTASSVSGILYNRRTLLFKFCALPSDEDLSSFIEDVRSLATSKLGVVPVGEDIPTSSDVLITDDIHTSFELERTALRSTRSNYRTRVLELETIVAEKEEHISKLECLLCSSSTVV